MSASDFAHQGRAPGGFDRVFHLACFGLCVAHAVYIVTSYASGLWLVDELGRGRPTDFVNVWAAGKLVLDGTPALAYDWDIHGKVEHAAVGYVFSGYYAWLYPPPFLAVAARAGAVSLRRRLRGLGRRHASRFMSRPSAGWSTTGSAGCWRARSRRSCRT